MSSPRKLLISDAQRSHFMTKSVMQSCKVLTKCPTKLIVGRTLQAIDRTYLLCYFRLVIIILVIHVQWYSTVSRSKV